MTDEQIKHMVDRFLSWKLPADFNPDNGISCQRPNYGPNVAWEPVGTNLLSATQADAMVRHMVEGLPDRTVPPGALDALRAYQQADDDGVMALVSRQALDEAIEVLDSMAYRTSLIGRISADNERLRKALEPFAQAADAVDAQHEKHGDASDEADLDFITDLKCGDLRRARKELSNYR